ENGGSWTSDDGTVWCDECFRRLFTFHCCKCNDYEHNDNQHRYMVVFDEEEAGIPRGVYRIIDKPYHISAMVGSGWLCNGSLLRVGEVPDGCDSDGYPCDHLCTTCSEKYEQVSPDHPCINPKRTEW